MNRRRFLCFLAAVPAMPMIASEESAEDYVLRSFSNAYDPRRDGFIVGKRGPQYSELIEIVKTLNRHYVV